MMMRSRAAVSLVVATCGLMLAAAVAYAQPIGSDGTVPPDFEGPCDVEATIAETGATIDPAVSGGVYTVPMEGTASWSGSIDVPRVEERPTAGSLRVLMPQPLPPFEFMNWTEPRDTAYEDAGQVEWGPEQVPPWAPRGVPFTVEGEHHDIQDCRGKITVKLEGGIFDSPLGIASVALTVLTGAVLLFAGVPSGGPRNPQPTGEPPSQGPEGEAP